MQSFKKYLLESVGHLPTVNVYVEVGTKITKGNFNALQFRISKYIKEEYKLTRFEINVKHNQTLLVTVHDIPQQLFDNTDFLGDIHDIVLDFYENPDDAYTHNECRWPPAYKMVIYNHLTTIYTNQESLKGIEKLIEGSSAYQLDIHFEAPAKSVGVLSLLKVKGFDSLVINGPDELLNDLRKVNDILYKHYNSSIDIIACQRELIENDLDEYAEF